MYMDLSPPTIDFQNLSLPHLAKKEEEGLNALQDCHLAPSLMTRVLSPGPSW